MTNRCALGGGESDGSAAINTTVGGILSTIAGVGCTMSEDAPVAGWCDETIDDGEHEVTLMINTEGADCTANEMVCTAYKGGVFGPDSACGGGGANNTSSSTTTDEVNEENIINASSLSQLDIPGANDDTTLTTEDNDDDDDNTHKQMSNSTRCYRFGTSSWIFQGIFHILPRHTRRRLAVHVAAGLEC